MARVHLLTVHPQSDPRPRGAYVSLKENAALDRFRLHQLVDNPTEADIILFAEVDAGRLCEDVLRHPFIKCYRDKCFLFSTDWRVVPFLPGIYTSLEKSWYLPRRSRPGFYLSCLINPLIKFEPDSDRDLLYSFMGDIQTHPVRRLLAEIDHSRGKFIDTSRESQVAMWRGTPDEKAVFWKRYAELMRRSRFVLCPRGVAPTSIRLFEAMMMGRVPVILSDEWLPPEGPAWEEFSLRIPESQAASVLEILEQKESLAGEMGLRARSEWEKYFSPDLVFHRIVEQCLEIRQARKLPEALDRLSIIPQLLRPRNIREYLRQWRRWLKE